MIDGRAGSCAPVDWDFRTLAVTLDEPYRPRDITVVFEDPGGAERAARYSRHGWVYEYYREWAVVSVDGGTVVLTPV